VKRVVSVVFKDGGKPYLFDAGELEPHCGERVVVETARGLNVGRVVSPVAEVDDADVAPDIKRVSRVAGADDLRRLEENRQLEQEARDVASDLIAEAGLPMKVVSVESTFDQGKILISFFSEDRVDFRQLVSRLSERMKRRVELRQVSARDEARLIGGYGSCGRRLCCTLFAGDQEPVSIRMAKDQNLPLNPTKISGVCGRLMCCLKYERDTYTAFRDRAPRRGRTVSTPAGEGKVLELLPTRESVMVDLGEGKRAAFTLAELGIDQEATDER
jgi:cell fate regulator YaaT (PSP1 superfamily)